MDRGKDIYLDYAAATPVDERVLAAMHPYMTERFANPSAPYSFARAIKADIEDARSRIAQLIGAKPANIVFTAGATEANNLAFTAASKGSHVLVSAIEHPSIFAFRSSDNGLAIEEMPVTQEGFVTEEVLENAIHPDTELVSVSFANGEIGTIQPIRQLAQIVHRERSRRLSVHDTRPIYMHTDASQAAASCMINVSSLGADLVTISAAKLYGPKQMGMLWVKSGIQLQPLIFGGGQENGLRSGTENVPGIIGFARAFEIARELREDENKRLSHLRDYLQKGLLEAFPWAKVSGPHKSAQRLDTLLHISFPGIEARRLVVLLEQNNVYVGTGSACAASKMQISHVLEAIGANPELSAGSLRISLGRHTSEADIENALKVIVDAVHNECNRLHILKGN